MKIIDISWPINELITAYKDKRTVVYKEIKKFETDGVRESIITLGSHTGTHVDAPSHFLVEGLSIDQVSLDTLVGPCKVFDLSHCSSMITMTDIESFHIEEGDIILFKTINSTYGSNDYFNHQFVYVDAQAAYYLAQKKIKAVGIDYLGIERNNPEHDTHLFFMKAGITIIEGLRLAQVEAAEYFLCCLPLHIIGLEAAPARAILLTD